MRYEDINSGVKAATILNLKGLQADAGDKGLQDAFFAAHMPENASLVKDRGQLQRHRLFEDNAMPDDIREVVKQHLSVGIDSRYTITI